MKKYTVFLPLIGLVPLFSACGREGQSSAGISAIYSAAALIAFVLLAGYVVFLRKKDGLFVLLFSAVFVINTGYYALSISQSLEQALWANRVAYLGSVCLPTCMLMIILKATSIRYPKQLPHLLVLVAGVVFLITASPGILPIYYKEVTFTTVNGVSMLQKVYGPWHSLYGVYLAVYFTAMVAVILYAARHKKVRSTGHVVILLIAVFVNLAIWLLEQIVLLDFEFLAVSYLISELFLLGLHLMMHEQQSLRALVKQHAIESANTIFTDNDSDNVTGSGGRYARYLDGVSRLTQTEKVIYDAYVRRMTTKEILELLNIKENTLKFHNKNLYNKLGVSSRKELQEIHGQLHGEEEIEKEEQSE